MTAPFYSVADNTDTVFANDIDQFSDAFNNANDVGQIKLFAQTPAPSAPTVAASATAGTLNGTYLYRIAFVTGYWKGQVGTGTLITQGNTSGGTVSASVSPASKQVNISAIPIGPVGTVARIIYRTKAGGSTYFQVAQINDNVTTTYTDNVADTSLTVSMPASNTTGTSFAVGIRFTVNGQTGAVSTLSNVLDDGSGNASFSGSVSEGGTALASKYASLTSFNSYLDQSVKTTATPTWLRATFSQATGTAPFSVTSTTVVTNLNANYLSGFAASTSGTANTVGLRDSSGSMTAASFIANATTGTAPFTVSSTTTVANLSASLLSGMSASTASTANTIGQRDSTGWLQALGFTSTATTGQAPFTVGSTTKVANLNVDLIDGYDTQTSATASSVAVRDGNADLFARKINAVWASTDNRTVKPNNTTVGSFSAFFSSIGGLNSGTADASYIDFLVLNGYTDTSAGNVNALAFLKSSKSIRHYQAVQTDTVWGTSYKTLAYAEDVLSLSGGTMANTTKVTNLNADYLDGMTSDSAATGSTIVARDAQAGISAVALSATGMIKTSFNQSTTAGAVLIGNWPTSNYWGIGGNTTSNDGSLRIGPANSTTGAWVASAMNLYIGPWKLIDSSNNVFGNTFTSSVATGTAPMTVSSTTMVTNLNANYVNGYAATTAATASTAAIRDASAAITASNFYAGTNKVWHAGNIVVSTTQPSSPAAGDVWIQY